jgi:ABC-2 type transport system ATP-binding protein
MTGRTWTVSRPGMRHRDLQAELDGQPGVVDALVQGEHVRLVAAATGVPDAVAGMADIVLREAAPRFEDCFVDLLRRLRGAPARVAAPNGAAQAHDDGAGAVVIRVDGLRRRFGDFWAVDGVDFQIRRGEIFGLLGANGAGKTTTFRMLCGLLPPSAGHIEVAGLDLRHAASAARARIGYMSQKFSLYGNLSAAQNLEFFASAYGLSGAARAQRIRWARTEFELTAFADQLAADLPLGYKQRLAMACALMHHPEIIFLDEPTSGVDPLARREFWQRINALAQQGVTVLVTTHFMEEAEYCDRLAIMAAGRILASDEPAAIKAMARSADNPEPSMEDAFIRLVEHSTLAQAA